MCVPARSRSHKFGAKREAILSTEEQCPIPSRYNFIFIACKHYCSKFNPEYFAAYFTSNIFKKQNWSDPIYNTFTMYNVRIGTTRWLRVTPVLQITYDSHDMVLIMNGATISKTFSIPGKELLNSFICVDSFLRITD